MKVLLDTNVILDYALERQPFFGNAEEVISLIVTKQVEGYISASAISDIYYILRKEKGRNLALEFLQELVKFFFIASVDSIAINMALSVNFRDFEDAIQYSTSLLNSLDAIVTRNPRDFPVTSPIVLTPEQLIQEFTSS